MTDTAAAPAAPAAAPAAGNAAPAAPAAQPAGQNGRSRVSSFEEAMERKNAALEARSQQPQVQQQPQRQPEPDQPEPGDQLAVDEPALDAEIVPDNELAPQQPGDDDMKLLAAIKQWRETGEAPEELLADLPFEWLDKNGNLVRETYQGLKERGMRLSDYHREMGVVRQREREMDIVRTNINRHFEEIRDPDRFLEEYEDRGYGDTLEKVAIRIAKRKTEDKQIAEAAGYRVMQQYGLAANHPDVIGAVRTTMQALQRNRAVDAENRRIKRQNEQLAQQRQVQDQHAGQQQRMSELGNSLAQLMPRAFQSAGVRNSPANQEAFMRHLNAVVALIPDWDGNVRRKDCITAARMLREELDDFDARRRRPAPATSRALPPGRQTQGGNARPVEPKRKRPSEMESDPRFSFSS